MRYPTDVSTPFEPAGSGAFPPDPAVRHANRIKAGPIGYVEGWVGDGDERLHFVEAGQGPLLLLYHGFPSFWYCWFAQMEALKDRYRVVAVDALGAARSARPAALDRFRIDRLAGGLDVLARHLVGDQRFTLMGHDWGAALAFAYAQAYPARLDAVIGLSAPPFNLFLDLLRDSPEQQERSSYITTIRALTLDDLLSTDAPERIWRQSYQDILASGALNPVEGELFRAALADPTTIHGGINWYRANIPNFAAIGPAHRWPRDHRPIAVPALLIWGEDDPVFVPEFLERMGDHADDLTIARLPDVGHWTSMDRPSLANAAIIDFLARVGAGDGARS